MAKLAEQKTNKLCSQNEAKSTDTPKSSQEKSPLKDILNKLEHLDPKESGELREIFSKFEKENPDHPLLKTLRIRMFTRSVIDNRIATHCSSLELSSKSTITPSEKSIEEIAPLVKKALHQEGPNHDNIIKLVKHFKDIEDTRVFHKKFDKSLVQDFKDSGASSQQIAEIKEAVSRLPLTGHVPATVRG